MNIGIIGSNGFLGSEIVRVLKRDKSLKVISITKSNYVVYKGCSFDVLINANGNSKKYWANKNPLEDFRLSTESVYQSVFDFKFNKYMYMSSIDAANNAEPYGFNKYLSEHIVKSYCNSYDILRCGAIIGKKMKKGVIKDILEGRNLYVTKDSRMQFITNTAIAEKVYILLVKHRRLITNITLSSTNCVSIEDVGKLLDKEINIGKNAKKVIYNVSHRQYPHNLNFKTAEEYIKEII